MRQWVPFVIGQRKEIEVALDWTSFWVDSQKTLSLNLLTSHGRATLLIWKTVEDSRLKNNQAHYEDEMLTQFKEILPEGVKITLVADRGFCSHLFLDFVGNVLGFEYAIRIKSPTTIISNKKTSKTASEWFQISGHERSLVYR